MIQKDTRNKIDTKKVTFLASEFDEIFYIYKPNKINELSDDLCEDKIDLEQKIEKYCKIEENLCEKNKEMCLNTKKTDFLEKEIFNDHTKYYFLINQPKIIENKLKESYDFMFDKDNPFFIYNNKILSDPLQENNEKILTDKTGARIKKTPKQVSFCDPVIVDVWFIPSNKKVEEDYE